MSIHEQARAACPHCPDGHAQPESRPWAVFVASEVDGDGQPTHLYVAPTAGQHVAESDAEWARARLNEAATRTRVVTTATELAAIPHNHETIVRGSDGQVWQRARNAWDCLSEDGNGGLYSSSAIALPASVLYDPEEDR